MLKVIIKTKRQGLVQISLIFKKTKVILLRSIYFCFKVACVVDIKLFFYGLILLQFYTAN